MKKIIAIFITIFLSACGGVFESANPAFMNDFARGNYNTAATNMSAKTQNPDGATDDIYLGGLQCSTGFLWAGNTDGRTRCLTNAEVVAFGQSTDSVDYVIRDYEKIMLKTYTAIGEMSDGDSHANQTLRQAYSLQQSIISANDSEISASMEKFNKDSESVAGLPDMDSIINAVNYEMAQQTNIVVMRDYVNPYTTYLSAIYDGVNGDVANSENYLKRVQQFAPENEFIRTDISAIKNKKNYVWIFFENGIIGPVGVRSLSPEILRAFNINLTIPDVYPGVIALDNIIITSGKNSVQTMHLADMDSVLKTDMEKYKTGNIIKSVSFEVGKLAAAATAGIIAGTAIGKQSDNVMGTYAGILIARAIMSAEKSWDVRSWDSLPTQIQSARIDMPLDRRLIIGDNINIEIPKGIKNAAIFVRIPTANAVPGIIIGKIN